MSSTLTRTRTTAATGIDPRGPRFGAVLTSVVLAATLLTLPAPLGVALLVGQTLVFGLAAFVGLSASPYGALYRRLVRPRLGAPRDLEAPEPVRFSQVVGFAFTAAALVAVLLGATLVAQVLVACALAAAFLNAAFGFCLGCETYLLARRLRAARG